MRYHSTGEYRFLQRKLEKGETPHAAVRKWLKEFGIAGELSDLPPTFWPDVYGHTSLVVVPRQDSPPPDDMYWVSKEDVRRPSGTLKIMSRKDMGPNAAQLLFGADSWELGRGHYGSKPRPPTKETAMVRVTDKSTASYPPRAKDKSPPIKVGDRFYTPRDHVHGTVSQGARGRKEIVLAGFEGKPAAVVMAPRGKKADRLPVGTKVECRLIRAYTPLTGGTHSSFVAAVDVQRLHDMEIATPVDQGMVRAAQSVMDKVAPKWDKLMSKLKPGTKLEVRRGPKVTVVIGNVKTEVYADCMADTNCMGVNIFELLVPQMDAIGATLVPKGSLNLHGIAGSNSAHIVGVLMHVPIQFHRDMPRDARGNFVVLNMAYNMLVGTPMIHDYFKTTDWEDEYMRTYAVPRSERVKGGAYPLYSFPFTTAPFEVHLDGATCTPVRVGRLPGRRRPGSGHATRC